jgi:ribonuclease HI
MSKYYAVKVGKIPGLYFTWQECQKQVNGFSGSIFKSFSTKAEALNFLYDGNVPPEMLEEKSLIARSHEAQHGSAIKIIPVIEPNNNNKAEEVFLPMLDSKAELLTKDRSCLEVKTPMIILYIDGSKRTSISHRGSGCYCRFNDKDFGLSLPFTKEIQIKYEIKDDDFEKLSSPTLEYLALAEVLWHFIYVKSTQKFTLYFVSDYIGVKCWTDGSWNSDTDYIIKIRNVVKKIIEFLSGKGIDVKIRHVKGHTLVFGNELSDLYAKNPHYFNTIGNLVNDVSQKYQ